MDYQNDGFGTSILNRKNTSSAQGKRNQSKLGQASDITNKRPMSSLL